MKFDYHCRGWDRFHLLWCWAYPRWEEEKLLRFVPKTWDEYYVTFSADYSQVWVGYTDDWDGTVVQINIPQ